MKTATQAVDPGLIRALAALRAGLGIEPEPPQAEPEPEPPQAKTAAPDPAPEKSPGKKPKPAKVRTGGAINGHFKFPSTTVTGWNSSPASTALYTAAFCRLNQLIETAPYKPAAQEAPQAPRENPARQRQADEKQTAPQSACTALAIIPKPDKPAATEKAAKVAKVRPAKVATAP